MNVSVSVSIQYYRLFKVILVTTSICFQCTWKLNVEKQNKTKQKKSISFQFVTQGAEWQKCLKLEVVTQKLRGHDTAVKNTLGNGVCAYPALSPVGPRLRPRLSTVVKILIPEDVCSRELIGKWVGTCDIS